MHLLLVEDDTKLASNLVSIIAGSGYTLDRASSYEEALAYALRNRYDTMIVDWMLPGKSGVEFVREIRDYTIATPVLMLTALSTPEEKAAALDAGADDYLTKPFSAIELMARIRALIRRESQQKQSTIVVGALVFDTVSRTAFMDKEVLELTPKELILLEYMMRNKNIAVTRLQLAEQLNRDLEYSTMSNVVDVHIKNIRKKIGRSEMIETIYGIGYIMKG